MIKIDIVAAIAVFLSCMLVLVFIFWIFYNYRERNIMNETRFFKQCPYCTYIFFYYQHDTQDFLTCPRCKSYIEK